MDGETCPARTRKIEHRCDERTKFDSMNALEDFNANNPPWGQMEFDSYGQFDEEVYAISSRDVTVNEKNMIRVAYVTPKTNEKTEPNSPPWSDAYR